VWWRKSRRETREGCRCGCWCCARAQYRQLGSGRWEGIGGQRAQRRLAAASEEKTGAGGLPGAGSGGFKNQAHSFEVQMRLLDCLAAAQEASAAWLGPAPG
jgi:hypothetical protein